MAIIIVLGPDNSAALRFCY